MKPIYGRENDPEPRPVPEDSNARHSQAVAGCCSSDSWPKWGASEASLDRQDSVKDSESRPISSDSDEPVDG